MKMDTTLTTFIVATIVIWLVILTSFGNASGPDAYVFYKSKPECKSPQSVQIAFTGWLGTVAYKEAWVCE